MEELFEYLDIEDKKQDENILKTFHERFPPVKDAIFYKWFPGLVKSGTAFKKPKMILLCFPNAGNAEDLFTNEGIGSRKVDTLLSWSKSNNIQLLSIQKPGRINRLNEPLMTSAQKIATDILQVVASRIISIPYAIIAHSCGCWEAYEFLHLVRNNGIQLPVHVFFSSFPNPDIPLSHRPWRVNNQLSEEEFKDEARGWNVNEVVFSDPHLWLMYKTIMKADFSVFDQYIFKHEGAKPFNCPLNVYWGTDESKITFEMVQNWKKHFFGNFQTFLINNGNHLFVMGLGNQRECKIEWLNNIVTNLKTYI